MRRALVLLLASGCAPGRAASGSPADADADSDADPDADSDVDSDADSDSDSDADDPRACDEIYAQDLLPELEVEVSAEDWADLVDEFHDWPAREAAGIPLKQYHPAVFRYGDEVVPGAAIRLKGNPCCSWHGEKMQFAISFNEWDPDGRWHGLRKIALDAPPYDPSLLKDRLALSYLRDLGVPAACANSARLVVNGEYYGAYTSIEHLDREFLERVFDDPSGNLYKYGWELRTNEEDGDTSRRDLFWATYDVPSLEALVDLDQAVGEWAAEAMIPHGDGYWAGSGNYYLYDEPGRGFVFVPWDLDYTFDVVPPDADPVRWRTGWGATQGHYATVLSDPAWFDAYVAAVGAARAGYDVATLEARVDEWSAQIADAVAEDPNKPYSDEEHDWAVATLRGYPAQRAAFVDGWLACMGGAGADADGDGFPWCAECDDASGDVRPDAAEACNGIDDDCDGETDELEECPDCVDAWLGEVHYSFCSRPRTWAESEAQCESIGGALAVPRSQEESDWMVWTGFGWSADLWWIGANDLVAEGAWTAPDGTALDFTPWAPAQPNGAEKQGCVVLDWTVGGWNDKSCEEAHPAVCALP